MVIHSSTGNSSADLPAAVDPGELPFLMLRALKALIAEAAVRRDEPKAHDTQLTAMHGSAARYIGDHQDVTVVELAAHLRVTKQSASEIVAALEKEGYVHRRPHPADGRARVVELTDSGVAGLVRSRVLWSGLAADWGALVGPDDLATTARVLQAFLDAHAPHP